MKGVQVMATITLQCNRLYQIHSSVYFRLKIARQVEKMLIQVWLKSIEMSELLDKQVNAQKENLNTSGVHTSSRKPTKKCAMKMKVEIKKKRQAPKIFLLHFYYIFVT